MAGPESLKIREEEPKASETTEASSPVLSPEEMEKVSKLADDAKAGEPKNEDELNERIDALKREAGLDKGDEDKEAQKEKELKEKRKEAVDAWIEASKALIEKGEEDLEINVWEETENAKEGKNFLVQNIESTIKDSEAVKSYIEEGEPKDLNLHWKINFADYNLQNGEQKIYITGIDVEMLVGGEPEKPRIQEGDQSEEIQKELLNEDQEKELENSEKIKQHKELKRNSAYMLP